MIVKSSAARQKEHVESTQFYIPFDGTEETCPWKVGDVYDTRPIIAIGFSENWNPRKTIDNPFLFYLQSLQL